MDQSDRIAEFDRFKNDEITVLVASDVAARGLDVKGVSHVINFDVPWQPDDYIHRIGRTGRAGAKGIAVMLATREDKEAVAAIEKLTGLKIAQPGKAEAKVEAPAAKRAPAPARPKAEKPASRTEPEAEKPAPRTERRPEKPAPRTEPKAEKAPKPEPNRERSPVVEDIAADWNGPMPGFLSVSAS
jgi:superfamily II DNA/RNA helicase